MTLLYRRFSPSGDELDWRYVPVEPPDDSWELRWFKPCPSDGMTHEGDDECSLIRGQLREVTE